VDGIVSWLMSTGLRPWLDPLPEDERASYLARYRALLEEAYPAQPDGTVLLRFPRLFIAGVR
jgi:trans-aconitate 2-methyltransferase